MESRFTKAIAETRSLGAKVEIDGESSGRPAISVDFLCDHGDTDSGLSLLADVEGLECLNLFDTKVTDAGLKNLAGLRDLRTLDLNYDGVTDAGMAHWPA